MKTLFAACAGLLALLSVPAAAQTSEPAVAVLHGYYTSAAVGGQTLHLLVSRGAGHTDETAIKLSPKAPAAAAEAYQQVVAQLYREGYALKGASAPGFESYLIFVKGP